MSKIRLHGASSGYVEIAPAAAASNNTLTAPSTVGEIIAKDAAGAIGVTSVRATNADFSGGTTRIGVGILSTSATVGAAVTISESGIEASGIGITCASINGTQIGGRKNLIINGAMEVAQRGTSSTDTFYSTVDRMRFARTGVDENPTQAQLSITSASMTALGFRKAFRVVNGNQTSGADAGDNVACSYRIEARDIRTSGWDYTNPNSFITLQFWVYSNVGQTYYMRLRSMDGTEQHYIMSYTLSANTWTKIVKTIPGNSNIQFDDDVNEGLQINWSMFTGTTYTDSGASLNTWGAFDTNAQYPDFDSTWYTTDNATWNITGLQLEVGPQATAFEHRSFAEELQLCKRYYQQYVNISSVGIVPTTANRSNNHSIIFPVEMRAAPSLTRENTGSTQGQQVSDGNSSVYITSLLSSGKLPTHMSVSFNLSGDLTNGRSAHTVGTTNTANQTTLKLEAEI